MQAVQGLPCADAGKVSPPAAWTPGGKSAGGERPAVEGSDMRGSGAVPLPNVVHLIDRQPKHAGDLPCRAASPIGQASGALFGRVALYALPVLGRERFKGGNDDGASRTGGSR